MASSRPCHQSAVVASVVVAHDAEAERSDQTMARQRVQRRPLARWSRTKSWDKHLMTTTRCRPLWPIVHRIPRRPGRHHREV